MSRKKKRKNPVLDWIEGAVERVRDFAYAERPPEAALPARTERPRVGIVLGGGFARGIAHLGVLRALEEHQIPIDCLAGTSAGALAAVAYASGRPFEEVVQRAAAIRFGNFGQWRFSRMGLASNQRLEVYPERYLGVREFKDLQLPVAIAATDLLSGEAVYFTQGLLGPAVRASCAYPGLFQPVDYQGRMLVDGFIAAAVPVEGARMLGAEVIVAVFLEAESIQRPRNVVDVIGRSFSIVRVQADVGWRSQADVIITPQVREFAWDDFEKTPLLVAAGRQAGESAIPKIVEAIRRHAQAPMPAEAARSRA